MKYCLFFTALVLLFSCKTSKDLPSEFVLGKGTNLAHWLSQSNSRGEKRAEFITENDIKFIASLGFNHVRLPIDEEQMWDTLGVRHDEAFDLMDSCIVWCMRNNLSVIVDLHILRSHHFNHAEKPLWTEVKEQERFLDMWRDLSEALHNYPLNVLAYEMMNEAVADNHEDWNQLLKKCFNVIREKEPQRLVVIGSNMWQSVNTFNELKVPENDPNIILSFHLYEPFLLTHYKASWTNIKEYEGPVHYPGIILTEEEVSILPEKQKAIGEGWIGKEFNQEKLEEMIQQPLIKAKELGLKLYCGEFGAVSDAPQEDRLRWYSDIVAVFEENEIGWANWNYKSREFGLLNSRSEKNTSLIDAILKNK